MSTRERGGIQAVIPWVALAVVTVFAFGQLSQRNRAQSEAVKARDDLRAMQSYAPPASESSPATRAPVTSPVAPSAPSSEARPSTDITARERKLDAALQGALEVAREDGKRLAVLRQERDVERRRAERLAAQLDTQRARAEALSAELGQVDREAHEEAIVRVQELAVALATAQAAHGAAVFDHRAQIATLMAQLNDALTRTHAAESELARLKQRVNEQLTSTAALREATENARAGMAARLEQLAAKAAAGERARDAAEAALVALRRRLRAVATVQLASENPQDVITGARMVGLLKLGGLGQGLLALTEHDDAHVAAAAAQALAAAPDLSSDVLAASDAGVALLADEAIGVRMAGLALLQAATGKEIAFDPAASPAARAAAIEKLKKRLGS